MASAASGRSILLADAALRAPKLDAALGIKAKDGLSDAAIKNKPVAVSRVNGYDYVGAGKSCDNPSAAVESIVSNDILRNLAAGYDTVIVLCENAVEYPDALTLSEDAAVTLLAAPLHKVSHAQFASVAADMGSKAKVIFTK